MQSQLLCVSCNRQVQEGIWNSTFYPNLLTMLSAFIVLAVIVVILSAVSTARHRKLAGVRKGVVVLSAVPLTTASMVLGIGLGGFADGIVLHQILQWHEMLSNKVPATDYVGKSVNMFWDGVFHFFCLIVVFIGVILLWRLGRRSDVNTSGRILSGGLLMGWGLFNIAEGIIDHHLLELHYVMQFSADPEVPNFVFLGISVLLLLAGWLLVRSAPVRTSQKGDNRM